MTPLDFVQGVIDGFWSNNDTVEISCFWVELCVRSPLHTATSRSKFSSSDISGNVAHLPNVHEEKRARDGEQFSEVGPGRSDPSAMKRRAMMGTVAWVLMGVLALVGSSPAWGQVEPALAEIEVEVRPEILGPVLFPWRTVKESTVPIRTLNKTDIGAAAVEQEEDHETQADMADAGPAIVYADGLLSPNW